MARVRPFRGFRYANESPDITRLVAPPYDVIGPEQHESLLGRDEHNIVALELPEGPLELLSESNRYATGARRWRQWRQESVVRQDPEAAIYALEQRWTRSGEWFTRRAFIAAVGLEPFDAGVVLPHERTLPKALDDRLNLTRACSANFSQVFGLYSDPSMQTATTFEMAIREDPIEVALDDDGVESRLWRLTDSAAVENLQSFFKDRQIFIADGHHRYTTALAYRDERRAQARSSKTEGADPTRSRLAGVVDSDAGMPAPGGRGPDASEHDGPAYDFVMMALVNMDDPDLVVLPTHRVADADGTFDVGAFWARLAEHFEIAELGPGHPSGALDPRGLPAFIVQTRDGRRRLATLKDGTALDELIEASHSSAWKHLDVAVLQELVLWPLLGIHPDRPQTLDRLAFVKDAHDALALAGEHDVAFILRPTRMEQLRQVALAKETMPQKSTYFYPKLLSGLVIRSLD